jgi:hypothetical protein
MKELTVAVGNAVMEHYHDTKPWGIRYVKFTIDFDRRGRIAEITHTDIPEAHKDGVLEIVRNVSQPHGRHLKGMSAHVVVVFEDPTNN